jgi:hypothetical protein
VSHPYPVFGPNSSHARNCHEPHLEFESRQIPPPSGPSDPDTRWLREADSSDIGNRPPVWGWPARSGSLHAIRSDQYKYIYTHGVWDHDGFYDLKTDPHEQHNLINVPVYQDGITAMKKQLFDELEERGGLDIPVRRPQGERLDQRKNR